MKKSENFTIILTLPVIPVRRKDYGTNWFSEFLYEITVLISISSTIVCIWRMHLYPPLIIGLCSGRSVIFNSASIS